MKHIFDSDSPMPRQIEGRLYGQDHIFLEKLRAVRGDIRIFVGMKAHPVSDGACLKGIRAETGQFFPDKAVNVRYRDSGTQPSGKLCQDFTDTLMDAGKL